MLMAEETTPVLLPGGLPELPGEGVGTAQALSQLQEYQRELELRNEQVGIDGFPALGYAGRLDRLYMHPRPARTGKAAPLHCHI